MHHVLASFEKLVVSRVVFFSIVALSPAVLLKPKGQAYGSLPLFLVYTSVLDNFNKFSCALNCSEVFNLVKRYLSYGPAYFLKRWYSRWAEIEPLPNTEYLFQSLLFEYNFNVGK